MKTATSTWVTRSAATLLLSIGPLAMVAHAQSPTDRGTSPPQAPAKGEAEKERISAEQQARKTLDTEAIAAIDETRAALKALDQNKPDDALAAIERASGKINVLVARNPGTALIPVAFEVEVLEGAPQDTNAIRAIAKAAERAVDDRDYPGARVLLQALTSEVRVRTYTLPLATYPLALSDAARMIDQKKTKGAAAVLATALNTLVMIDRVTPLPLVLAQTALEDAQALREKNKDEALRLLAAARNELERAKELGYAGKDPEYAALNSSITEIEKQIKGNSDTTSLFSRLHERVASFFQRLTGTERRSAPAKT